MTYYLTSIDPPEIITDRDIENLGFPLRRNFPGDASEMKAPDGCRYLPSVEQEKPTPGENEKLVRLPDAIIGDEVLTNRYEVIALTPEEIDAKQRATQRSALRQQWEALPAYIRGPYRDKFEAANRLLDEGDDESAIHLIDYATPMPDFTAEQITVFNSTKAAMKTGIEALPGIA